MMCNTSYTLLSVQIWWPTVPTLVASVILRQILRNITSSKRVAQHYPICVKLRKCGLWMPFGSAISHVRLCWFPNPVLKSIVDQLRFRIPWAGWLTPAIFARLMPPQPFQKRDGDHDSYFALVTSSRWCTLTRCKLMFRVTCLQLFLPSSHLSSEVLGNFRPPFWLAIQSIKTNRWSSFAGFCLN